MEVERKIMAKGFEFNLYHCYKCGEFRVRVPSGEMKLLEPCPKCETECGLAMPYALDIEFTNRCGGQCMMCPRGKGLNRSIGDMSEDLFDNLAGEIRDWNTKQPNTIRMCFGHMFGESVTHPMFVPWVNRLATKTSKGGSGLGTIIVSTNAMGLTKELGEAILASKLHRLIISIDAVSKETLKKIRPGLNFERVQHNIDEFLLAARKRSALDRKIPSIWVQILKLDANKDEWLPFARRYMQNAKLRVITPKGRQYREMPGLPGGKVFFKTVEAFGGQYADAATNAGWDAADHRRDSCQKHLGRMSIWQNGVVPEPACCYTADADNMLGTMEYSRNSLHGIWLGDRFQAVRRQFTLYQQTKGRQGVLPVLCREC